MPFNVPTATNYPAQSMTVQQKIMATIGENLANANNPVYSKKSVKTLSDPSGIRALAPESIKDPIRTEDVRLKRVGVGYLETFKSAYDSILLQFGTPSDKTDLGSRLTDIKTELGKLQDSAQDTTLQQSAIGKIHSMLTAIKSLSSSFQHARKTTEDSMVDSVQSMTGILEKLDKINGALSTASSRGDQTSDLVDNQNALLQDLSQYLDLSIYRHEDMSLDLTTNSGQPLLLRSGPKKIVFTPSTTIGPADTAATLQRITVDGQDIGPSISNGKIAAYLKVRDELMPRFQAQVDEFSEKLRDSFNAVHNRGTPFPPQQTLTGTQSFANPATSTLSMTGLIRIGILNPNGTHAAAPLDFDFTGGPHTLNAVMAQLNAQLGANGTATFNANGQLVLQATNPAQGLAIVSLGNPNESLDQTTGKGFSHFFGLNDFFISGPDKIGLAQTVEIRPDIKGNAALLSRGSLSTTTMGIGEAGLLISTNNIVTELQDVFDNPVTFGDAGTLSGRRESLTHYANSIWHDAAVRSKNCTKDYETDLGVFQASEKDLRARTGVNISEEIVLLLESQKIFAASAKCLQIFDKCLEKLMSI